MIDLNSPRWTELQHAYGAATAIPLLLQQLQDLPTDEGDAEPWFSLWSALAHQGDVYQASFAAVPHIIAALSRSPETASEVYFHFPTWIEICRNKHAVRVDRDLEAAYFDALARLPALVEKAAGKHWDTGFAACALSATAVAKGQHALAEALLALSSDDAIDDVREWMDNR